MSNIVTNSPYTDDVDDREGRLAVVSTSEDWYNTNTAANAGGADATVPYEDEIAHTKEGDFVVMTRDPDTNQVIAKSASRELRKKLEQYEKAHIFENAEAFTFNSALNILYYDPSLMTVKMSSDRVFSTAYKYWAITGVSDTTGKTVFYTGISSQNSDGSSSIKSNLIDTTIVRDDNGSTIGVTCSGHLISALTHASNYRVIFYDADMIQIDQMVFQAYNVRGMTFDVQPESAVKDVQIAVAGVSNDTISLQQGESWASLGLRIYLIYANNETKDITSEWSTNGSTTGRVIIDGLNKIDSSKITPNNEEGQKITVTYFLSSSNTTNSQVKADTLSISHTYTVRIVSSSEDSIVQVIPSVWIEGNVNSTARLCMKIFSVNKDSNNRTFFVDNTYRLREKTQNSAGFIGEGGITVINNTDPDKIYYQFNNSIASEQTFTHIVPVPYGSLLTPVNYVFKTRGIWSNYYAEFTDPVASNNINASGAFSTSHILTAVLVNESDGTTRLKLNLPSGNTAENYLTKLKNDNKIILNSKEILPTHIRLRNGKDPTYFHSSIIELNTDVFNKGVICFQPSTDNIAYLAKKTPIIVEFINQTTDASLNVEKIITKLSLYFVNTTVS